MKKRANGNCNGLKEDDVLPRGWARTTLAAACSPVDSVSPAALFDGTFRYVDISSIDNERQLIVQAKEVPVEDAPSRAKQLLKHGDVVFSTVRVYLRNIGYVDQSLDGQIGSTGFCVLRGAKGVLGRYLYRYVTSDRFIRELLPHQRGNSPPAVLEADIKAQPFNLPPTAEQERIVAKLDELFSQIEKGEENLRRVQTLVKRYRQAVLKAAVTGELTRDWREKNAGKGETGAELLQRILVARRDAWEKAELAKMKAKSRKPRDDGWKRKYEEPEPADVSDLPDLPLGWAWASLNQLSWSSSYGTSTKCSYEGEGPPVLRIPNVRSGGVVLDDLKYAIGRLAVAAHEYLAPGDLLVVRTNGSRALIGLGAVVDRTLQDPTYFASYLIRFRLNTVGAVADWVNTFWQSDVIRQLVLKNAATSAGQYNISQTVMSAFPVALPPVAELDEVLLRVQSMLTRVDAVERAVTEAAGIASALRQSTLRAAFSGELVAQESGDEPATMLLERIAAERANSATTKPRRGRQVKAAVASVQEALS